jgi:hypothetical protein
MVCRGQSSNTGWGNAGAMAGAREEGSGKRRHALNLRTWGDAITYSKLWMAGAERLFAV